MDSVGQEFMSDAVEAEPPAVPLEALRCVGAVLNDVLERLHQQDSPCCALRGLPSDGALPTAARMHQDGDSGATSEDTLEVPSTSSPPESMSADAHVDPIQLPEAARAATAMVPAVSPQQGMKRKRRSEGRPARAVRELIDSVGFSTQNAIEPVPSGLMPLAAIRSSSSLETVQSSSGRLRASGDAGGHSLPAQLLGLEPGEVGSLAMASDKAWAYASTRRCLRLFALAASSELGGESVPVAMGPRHQVQVGAFVPRASGEAETREAGEAQSVMALERLHAAATAARLTAAAFGPETERGGR